MLVLANWPYTLIGMIATNKAIEATALDEAGAESRALIEKWGRLHAVRTVLGVAAALAYPLALN